MAIVSLLRTATLAAGTVVFAASLPAAPASAQLFWDWGGGEVTGGSGREVVRFNPRFAPGHIIVSFGDRRLYYVSRSGEAISYPIAIPRDEDRWEGDTVVSNKRINPSWTPTPAMVAENPRLPRWVPGGHPMNPLGVRALYLGSSTYRIHGTDAPWTIGTAVSKGCIRMYNQDVLDLYPRVTVGAKVTVTWQRFGGAPDVAYTRSPPLRSIDRSDLPRRF
jgi:lipoprotein-anchoring transpeptidase ErfK/SrfK